MNSDEAWAAVTNAINRVLECYSDDEDAIDAAHEAVMEELDRQTRVLEG